MGIQPIDLQTMYSQLSNLSKTMSGAQQAQLTEAMQQQNNIQKSMENAARVHETSNEQSNANAVNQDGSNASFAGNGGKKKQEPSPEEAQDVQNEQRPAKSPYSKVGTIIDIMR